MFYTGLVDNNTEDGEDSQVFGVSLKVALPKCDGIFPLDARTVIRSAKKKQ